MDLDFQGGYEAVLHTAAAATGTVSTAARRRRRRCLIWLSADAAASASSWQGGHGCCNRGQSGPFRQRTEGHKVCDDSFPSLNWFIIFFLIWMLTAVFSFCCAGCCAWHYFTKKLPKGSSASNPVGDTRTSESTTPVPTESLAADQTVRTTESASSSTRPRLVRWHPRQRTVQIQTMTTYSWVRGDLHPRFHICKEEGFYIAPYPDSDSENPATDDNVRYTLHRRR